MRILHVIYDDIGNPWLGGGGAIRTLEIYSRIVEKGHSVTVLCGRYPGAARTETRRGVTYKRVGLTQSYILSRLSFVVGAARLITRGGYDIVIEDVSPFSPVAAPRWKSLGVPAVASVQNLSGAHATSKYGLPGWGPRMIEKPLLSLFTNFIAVSPGISEQLKQMLGPDGNVRVVPNSVDPVFFESGAEDPARYVQEGYVLSLGRIDVYQKGLDRLIAAFDIAAERRPKLRLLIAGDGTQAQVQQLSALVDAAQHKDRIEILGPVSQERAAQLMRKASLLAMPSRYEAWPLSALEAGAAGIPVVGSDIVGVRDAAPHFPEAHGVLVPEGDLSSLADAIVRVAYDPALRAEAGLRGRQWAERFTWDALADAQLAFYEELIRNAERG